MKKNGMEAVAPGMEPTGHYWFNLGAFLQDKRNRATQKAMQNGKRRRSASCTQNTLFSYQIRRNAHDNRLHSGPRNVE